jgi:hypothetical protein
MCVCQSMCVCKSVCVGGGESERDWANERAGVSMRKW